MYNGSGNVGKGKKGDCWIIVRISMKIIVIPPGLIISLGNRAVINSSNGGFLRKVAKFTCGCLFIPYIKTRLNERSARVKM